MSILRILKGVGGEFEIGRVLLASSGVAAIVSPIVFEALDMYHNGWHFDPAVWCVAYPGGLAALSGIGVFALGRKDRDVAVAKQTQAVTDNTISGGTP